MKAYFPQCVLVYLTLALVGGSKSKKENVCSLWKYYDNTTNECQCGSNLTETIKCKEGYEKIQVRSCYCMSFDKDLREPVVGTCLYSCHIYKAVHRSDIFYEIDTNSTSVLNNVTCGPYNRRGVMCGECIEGHGLPVYSYSLSCVECTHYKYNWIKYIAVAYIPLTLFLIVVIIFRISATSGSMVGYVTVSQLGATYSLSKLYLAVSDSKWVVLVYSIWNLDLFRSIYPPFCIHPHMSALQVVSLDYIIAVYPMIMILITYGIVSLHDRYSQVIWLCRPLYTCLHRFRKEWDIRSSLIGAFATMLFLSYVKILNVSSNILIPQYILYMNGSHSKPYVSIDTDTPYLSKTHLPYFILALAMLFVFNIVPLLLLCLYPCRCFKTCLNRTGLQHHALHTFMDAFQGCYRHKPYDLRYFSALSLLAQIINLGVFFIFRDLQYHTSACYMLIAIIILLGIARPYRKKWHNVINITLFTSMLTLYLAITTSLEEIYFHNIIFPKLLRSLRVVAIYIPIFVPLLYGVFLFFGAILPSRIKRVISSRRMRQTDIIESLPYRIKSNEEYTPLISQACT